MKIPKSLLQAIMVGATIGAASSCSFLDNTDEIKPEGHDETCTETCDIDHSKRDGHVYYDCPACGMG